MNLVSGVGLPGTSESPATLPGPQGPPAARSAGDATGPTFRDHLQKAMGSPAGAASAPDSPPGNRFSGDPGRPSNSPGDPVQQSDAGAQAWLDLVRIWVAERMASLPGDAGSLDSGSLMGQGDRFGSALVPFLLQVLFASGASGSASPTPPTFFTGALGGGTPATPPGGLPVSSDTGAWNALIRNVAARRGLDPALLRAVMMAESGGNPAARSPAGALGLMQLMPSTAQALGVDPLDPAQNLDGGAMYLRSLLDRYGGDVMKATAAYNAGPGAVDRYGGIPPYPETKAYVQRIQQLYARYV